MKSSTFQKLALIVVLIGVIARLPLLGGSLWLDEAAQAIESARPLSEQFDIIADFQPPLLHLILHFAQLVSHHEAWMRLWGAFIPGIITLVATLYATRKLFSKNVALFATFLLSISSFHVYFSQELRPYALPAMWAALAWYVLALLIQKTKNKKRPALFVIYGIISWMGLFSSYLYPFFLFGQVVFMLATQKKEAKTYLLTLVATSLAYVPWLPTFLKQLAEGRHVQSALPGWSEVVSISQLKSIPLTIGKFIYGVLYIDPTPFFIISGMLLVTSFALLSLSYYKKNKAAFFSQKVWVLLAWFVIPLVSAWLISFIVPVVQPKRMLLIQPGLLIGFAYLIEWALQQKKQLLTYSSILLTTTLIGLSIVSLATYYTNSKLQREDWRSLHTEILAKYPSNAVAVFSFTNPFAPWEWYDSGTYPTFSTQSLTIAAAPDLLDRSKELLKYDYILVFDHLRTLTDPNDEILDLVKDFGYSQVELIDYPNIGFVRVFVKHDARISAVPRNK